MKLMKSAVSGSVASAARFQSFIVSVCRIWSCPKKSRDRPSLPPHKSTFNERHPIVRHLDAQRTKLTLFRCMCSCDNTAFHCGQRRSTYRTFRSRQIADATSRRGVGARETMSFVSIGATLPRFRKLGEGSELASSSRICDPCS